MAIAVDRVPFRRRVGERELPPTLSGLPRPRATPPATGVRSALRYRAVGRRCPRSTMAPGFELQRSAGATVAALSDGPITSIRRHLAATATSGDEPSTLHRNLEELDTGTARVAS